VQRHRTRFLQPATVTFSQVFLSSTARATGLDEQARTLLARLRSKSLPPQTAAAFSDPFALAADLRGQSRAEQLLPIDAIRLSVTYEILQERAQLRYARAMERLRALDTVHIERDDSAVIGSASAKGSRS